jgi:hypothetical protein
MREESMTLADRIERRIRNIPANNPGYISVCPENLGSILSNALLRKIAQEAADEATTHIKSAGD